MRLSGNDLSKRLEDFSSFTLLLISEINRTSRETIYKALDITTDSELTEEQIIEKLLELLSSYFKLPHPVSYDEALEIVCNSFEQGYIYPLYAMLDNDATLVFADDCILSDRDIVVFLSEKSPRHLYRFDEGIVTCDVLRVAEGERYGVGERCILLTYPSESGKKQYRIIKIHFDNGKIYKLELFYPIGPLHLVADE